ncbi:hypothetical protein E2C01_077964 [Portunus trituberculatus]|uniref:Uncharacterized protein n=1 Tax=Portunus trituberculatus TaxID=210409 RepID=A0A5B7IMP2_PORTR|nr:hypothetical protein [Portunus trituberculatus]
MLSRMEIMSVWLVAGAGVRDVAVLVSRRRGGGAQESGEQLRHGLAHHQRHRLL